MKASWRKSISRRFLFIVVILVTSISLSFFIIESLFTYKREVERMNQDLLQIRESHLPSLISSLWLTDYTLLQLQLDAIARFRHIDRVEVETDEGSLFHSGGDSTAGLQKLTETLVYKRRDTSIEIGFLHLYIDQQELRLSAYRQQGITFLGHLAALIGVSFAVSLLFRREVAGPIENLEAALQKDSPEKLGTPLRLPRRKEYPDELNFLIGAINLMRSKLHRHMKERELLLAEVHHRIKNDMNFVKALLLLQAEHNDSPEVSSAIEEASRRVSVMARIYERLYSDADFREVALRPLAEQVVQDALELSGLSEEMISISVEELTVPTRESLSIGIILNELITNAVKYAFTPGTIPRIEIRIVRNDDFRSLDVTVADNGRGFPEDVISGGRRGYGLTIVKALAEQHDGILEFRNESGGIILARLKRV